MRRPSLSYANVTATLALIVALGGTSYAAVSIDGADIQRKSIPLNRLKGKLPKGPRGATGSQGLAGAAGAAGAAGQTGEAGPAGSVGPAGIRGPKGDIGPTGVPGSTGAQGLTGDDGDQGPQGVQGPAGLVSDTVFQSSGAVDLPSGQNHALVTATGLAAGTYLVTFRTELSPVQAYTCGIASGSLLGPTPITMHRHGGTDPETYESTGVMTVLQAGESQILYCNGDTDEWDAGSSEVDFIKIDAVVDGVEG
jgi:hypothetical protein